MGVSFCSWGLWGDCEQPGLSGSLSIWPYWLHLCVLLALKCFWQNSLKSDATSKRGLWRISSRHLFSGIKKFLNQSKKKKGEEEIWEIPAAHSPDSRCTSSAAVLEDYNDDVTSWKLNMKVSVNMCTVFTHYWRCNAHCGYGNTELAPKWCQQGTSQSFKVYITSLRCVFI